MSDPGRGRKGWLAGGRVQVAQADRLHGQTAGHWRLHLTVFACTFVLFPLLGLALKPVLTPLIGTELYGDLVRLGFRRSGIFTARSRVGEVTGTFAVWATSIWPSARVNLA